MKHAVNIDLPRATSEPEQTKPQNIVFTVAADGTYYWNEQKIEDAELVGRLAAEAAKEPQPELHIRGDKAVRYERVAQGDVGGPGSRRAQDRLHHRARCRSNAASAACKSKKPIAAIDFQLRMVIINEPIRHQESSNVRNAQRLHRAEPSLAGSRRRRSLLLPKRPARPLFESAELLKGGKAVGIMHNGSLYRLQATKLGKLILTK